MSPKRTQNEPTTCRSTNFGSRWNICFLAWKSVGDVEHGRNLWWFSTGRMWKHVFACCRLVGGRLELRGILRWVVAKYDGLQLVLRACMSHVLSVFQIGRNYLRPRQTDEKQQWGNVDVVLEVSSVLSPKTGPQFWALFVRILDRTCVCQCGRAVVAQHPQFYSVCALKPCVCKAQCGKKVVLVVRLLFLPLLPTHRRFQSSVFDFWHGRPLEPAYGCDLKL